VISKRIKQIRQQSRLSQQDFGKHLGVSRDVIGNLEYGRVEPKEPFIDLLCHVFDINRDWLLTGEGEPTDTNIESRKNIDEAIRILGSLSPELQDYALDQMRGLLRVQGDIKGN
jgi:transcriptional regulator with XRE-family HTH domain